MRSPAFAACIFLLAAGAALAKEPANDIAHLWRISRAGIPPSHVFGTIHVADARVATLPVPVRDALSRSRTLAVEIVPEAVDAGAAEFELLDDGARLAPILRPEIYAKLTAELADRGVPVPVIERL